VLETDTQVLGLSLEWRGNSLLTFHNLSDSARPVDLLTGFADACFDNLLDGSGSAGSVRDSGSLELPPYGYFWLRPQAERR
jgi:hypothetical protein